MRLPGQPADALTLGAEEEFFVVDARTLQLANAAPLLLPTGDTEGLQQELFECIVETTTPILLQPRDALASLVRARRRVAHDCESHGLRLLAVGSYPGAVTMTPRVTSTPYYRRVAERLGDSLAGQLLCGLHVHIGFPTARRTHNALEGMIPWLPALLAVGANSPLEEGQAAPVLSVRAARLAALSESPLPPARNAEAGAPPVPSAAEPGWWDIRPNMRHGTLEIRVPDQPTDVRRSAAIVALVHALAVTADRRRNPSADRAAYHSAREAAVRGAWSRVAVEQHVEPVATEIGTWPLIVDLLAAEREAERQLRVARERGVPAVLEDLAERTTSYSLP